MSVLIPFIEELTAGTRLALPYIKSLAETDLSANKIITTLQEAGLGARRSDVFRAVRAFRDQFNASSYIKSVRNNFLPNPKRFPVALTTTLRDFSYQVKVEGRHSITGQPTTQWITVSTNDVLTKDQVYDAATGIVEEGFNTYNIEEYDLTVTDALRAPSVLF